MMVANDDNLGANIKISVSNTYIKSYSFGALNQIEVKTRTRTIQNEDAQC